jgi:hypothetical protein
MSHPAWHSTVWQTYDYDLDVNGGYYGARKGCEALHVQADPAGQVIAVNHTPDPVKGATVRAELYGLDGHRLADATSAKVDIGASATAPAFAVPFADALPALHLLRLTLTDAGGATLSENTYWRYRTPKDMQALGDLARTKVTVETGPVRRTGGGREVTATVRNRGDAVAALLRLSLRDRHSGARILPARYDDNYLWLLPGETRHVTIAWSGTAAVRVTAEAYNVPAVSG